MAKRNRSDRVPNRKRAKVPRIRGHRGIRPRSRPPPPISSLSGRERRLSVKFVLDFPFVSAGDFCGVPRRRPPGPPPDPRTRTRDRRKSSPSHAAPDKFSKNRTARAARRIISRYQSFRLVSYSSMRKKIAAPLRTILCFRKSLPNGDHRHLQVSDGRDHRRSLLRVWFSSTAAFSRYTPKRPGA